MKISAKQVKTLRDATGAGMMACKKALIECGGDIEEATTYLKKKGIADSKKRAGRTATQGVTVAHTTADGRRALLLELNCETDFVARNQEFVAFANSLVAFAEAQHASTLGDLLGADYEGRPLTERIDEQSGKTGERLVLSRIGSLSLPEGSAGGFGSYVHDGGKIGVVIALSTATSGDVTNEAFTRLAKDLAMHVAASDPAVVSSADLDPALVEKEREIFIAQAEATGKPREIAEKIVVGRLNKWKKEISLGDQPFVKDTSVTVAKHVAEVSKSLSGEATITGFLRYRLGEASA